MDETWNYTGCVAVISQKSYFIQEKDDKFRLYPASLVGEIINGKAHFNFPDFCNERFETLNHVRGYLKEHFPDSKIIRALIE